MQGLSFIFQVLGMILIILFLLGCIIASMAGLVWLVTNIGLVPSMFLCLVIGGLFLFLGNTFEKF